jgi:hypothetical protein
LNFVEGGRSRAADQSVSYMVFITPEGDNRGLYVTQKSGSGFEVRESQGGHSTLPFNYRTSQSPLVRRLRVCPRSISRPTPA